jgi:hypothetical protein
MSNKTGLPSTIIKFTIPSTASNVAFNNGNLAIGNIKAGRYLCILSYSLDPITAGAQITAVNAFITAYAVLGGGTAVSLLTQATQPFTSPDVNSRMSLCSVVTLSTDAPIFISIIATTNIGSPYQTTAGLQDSQSNTLSFIQLQ